MTDERLERLAGQMMARLLTTTPGGDIPTLARQAVQSARALSEALSEPAEPRMVVLDVVATHLAATEAVPVPECPPVCEPAPMDETMEQRVRRLREAAGLTQRQLADKAELHHSVVARAEGDRDGEPTHRSVYKIAKALGVSMRHLLTGTD